MTTRLVMPVINQAGLEAPVAEHFGKAPYFAIVDLDDNKNVLNIKTEMNRSEHAGGVGLPHENLLVLKPDMFIVYGMGPGCLRSLQNMGVTVLKAVGSTVNDVVNAFKAGKLAALEGGCQHSHQH
ncbi:MAG: NifB/NifX family molybdenum-iron cluster-binding protein [Candidatus Bathyarchaeota archaeon]|nr:NifB/NifX family molybdenum-iron cluster-binding protein [Candidatus Bathyarchaeota archaeon]